MPRRNQMPNPDARSPDEPTIIAKKKTVLDVFNDGKPAEEQATNVTKKVKAEFEQLARDAGWDSIEFHGSQAVLRNTAVENAKKNKET